MGTVPKRVGGAVPVRPARTLRLTVLHNHLGSYHLGASRSALAPVRARRADPSAGPTGP
ncbi:hypothetical protein GCM10010472_50300 [Pseudonocardia halophobica]|uniref:Uncharacterized protein n=1 Tax=Pseudonocardia halophobica TaxID=29401 RepID=A0A9W6NYY9_9PSEU|nr:hypothetical protein GCM10017577_61740 [Pseudonocardia halophobica]